MAKSTSNENSVKENDTVEEFTDPLLEPAVVINIEEDVQPKPSHRTKFERFVGIIYAILAAFIVTVSLFITKELKVDLFSALLPRFTIHSIILIIYMKLIKHYTLYHQLTKTVICLLLISVFTSTSGFLAYFLANRYLPLPDVTTVRYTQIIWTAIIMSILYCERPSIVILLGVILTTTGVIFVAQPKFLFDKTSTQIKSQSSINHHNHLIGLAIVLYASIAFSLVVISNKYLLTKYKIKESLVLFHYSFASSCVLIIYLSIKYYPSSDRIQSIKTDFFNWKYLCASSACLFQIISSILSQKAVKREHPSIYTICRSTDILFSIILQNIFSVTKSNLLSLIGSALVLASILIISGHKLISEKKKPES